MNLSKSRYTLGITCKKKLWLSIYKKEEAINTGDNIITYITMFILSTAGILLAINKKRKIS